MLIKLKSISFATEAAISVLRESCSRSGGGGGSPPRAAQLHHMTQRCTAHTRAGATRSPCLHTESRPTDRLTKTLRRSGIDDMIKITPPQQQGQGGPNGGGYGSHPM
jgi:hypothetical protein